MFGIGNTGEKILLVIDDQFEENAALILGNFFVVDDILHYSFRGNKRYIVREVPHFC